MWLLSSGAIALGSRELGIDGRALARKAGGSRHRVVLAHAWREALASQDIGVAQIALPEDTETGAGISMPVPP